jgi:hypothetical protein
LEDQIGSRKAAVDFEQHALGLRYQHGDPEECAISHHNLASYLARQGADPSAVLAHRLADAIIMVLMKSGGISQTVRTLTKSDLPARPPAFAGVVAQVEAVPGVRFAALVERLPRTVPDGDAAIAAVWRLVAEARDHERENKHAQTSLLASLPPAVRAAFDLEGDAFSRGLQEALQALPPAEAATIVSQLRDAGLIGAT